MAEMTTLEDELNKLKKTLQQSRDDIMKLQIKEDAHKKVVDKLNAEIKKLKDDAPLIYKTGYDNAVDEVVRFASGLKPKPSN
jgi:septal ring factor EnvC (AmiA/AmiB activator)